MKPGEFVIPGWHIGGVYVYKADGSGGSGCVSPDNPDFPAAVAALQALIQPSLDPRSGRVLAMRGGSDFEWDGLCDPIYRHRLHDGRVQFLSKCGDGWLDSDGDQLAAFEAGRRYERERV